MRKKVQKDLFDQHKVMQRFGVPAWDELAEASAWKNWTKNKEGGNESRELKNVYYIMITEVNLYSW